MKNEILIVDDDPAVREGVAKLLTEKGYEVLTAEGGFAALGRLKLRGWVLPDVIVSDLNMPEMSGSEFLSVVRLPYMHVFLVTSDQFYQP